MRRIKSVFWVIGLMIGLLFLPSIVQAPEATCPTFSSFFCKSLHYTGKGMRSWYEDGFMKITGIPYKNLGCKKCHAKSCDRCHAVEKEGKMAFSTQKARSSENCLACHARIKSSIKFDQKMKTPDVHLSAGISCIDCHSADEIHGDGTTYRSMRQPGAVTTSCEKCHKEDGEAPFEAKMKAHRIHRGKLHCEACHVKSNMTCYNCHFSHFLETKKKKAIPMKSFVMLINYQGKVTAGNVMAIVYKERKFIAYVPNFTHSITAEGRRCGDCHNNRAIQLIKKGKRVPVVSFKNGKIVPWKGAVPAVPDKLQWTFFDWKGNKWIPLKTKERELVQFAAFGEPLTTKQLKKLYKKFGK